jgi:hypothetical protein
MRFLPHITAPTPIALRGGVQVTNGGSSPLVIGWSQPSLSWYTQSDCHISNYPSKSGRDLLGSAPHL